MNGIFSNNIFARFILLVSLAIIFVASWQDCSVADAAPFPKFAINLRKNGGLASPPSRAAASETKKIAQNIPSQHRGGATAAVKTMTARQMEAFK